VVISLLSDDDEEEKQSASAAQNQSFLQANRTVKSEEVIHDVSPSSGSRSPASLHRRPALRLEVMAANEFIIRLRRCALDVRSSSPDPADQTTESESSAPTVEETSSALWSGDDSDLEYAPSPVGAVLARALCVPTDISCDCL